MRMLLGSRRRHENRGGPAPPLSVLKLPAQARQLLERRRADAAKRGGAIQRTPTGEMLRRPSSNAGNMMNKTRTHGAVSLFCLKIPQWRRDGDHDHADPTPIRISQQSQAEALKEPPKPPKRKPLTLDVDFSFWNLHPQKSLSQSSTTFGLVGEIGSLCSRRTEPLPSVRCRMEEINPETAICDVTIYLSIYLSIFLSFVLSSSYILSLSVHANSSDFACDTVCLATQVLFPTYYNIYARFFLFLPSFDSTGPAEPASLRSARRSFDPSRRRRFRPGNGRRSAARTKASKDAIHTWMDEIK